MTLWVGIIQKIEFLLSFKHFLWLFNEAFGLFWQPQNPTMPKTGVLGFALKCIGMYLVLTELTISYYLIWSIRTRYYSEFNMVKFIANNLKGQYLHNLLLPLCLGQHSFLYMYTLTVVEWKDYHFLAVATVSDLQNSYCNQWPHPYEPQISSRFVFSAVCLHFTAN